MHSVLIDAAIGATERIHIAFIPASIPMTDQHGTLSEQAGYQESLTCHRNSLTPTLQGNRLQLKSGNIPKDMLAIMIEDEQPGSKTLGYNPLLRLSQDWRMETIATVV